MNKNLVAFFSKAGEQYGVGEISKGNTAIVAEIIAQQINADIFEIKVINDDYPNKYDLLIQRAKEEKAANIRPEIEGHIEEFDNYENIFIGYPNWWGDMPMAVYTFLQSYDFSRKKVYHFCTHEGSGSVRTNSFDIYGHIAQKDIQKTKNSVKEWLDKLNL